MTQEPVGYWERRWTGFRAGSTRMVLTWPGGRAEAVVYDEGAPRTAAAVLASLPLTVPVIHVAWSGDMLMSAEPVEVDMPDEENFVRLPLPGDLAWDAKVGELTFTYGVAECHTPALPNTISVYGTIVSGLEEFAAFGRARRFEGLGHVEMHRS